MSYKIKKPITDIEKSNFIVEHNHNQGLLIKDGTDTYIDDDLTLKGEFLFALLPNEIMADEEVEIDVPDFETVEEEYQVPIYDEETGEVDHYETRTREIQVPVMIEVEIEVPDYDEEGHIIGYHTEIVEKQKHHKETTTVYRPVINPNYDKEQADKREAEFNKAFFLTSLGYIRRSVTMADGSHKDFLSDLMPTIKMGLESGIPVNILTYDKPPFDHDIEDWTEYQHQVVVTAQFIQECFLQLSADFAPINNEEEDENTTNE